LLPERGNRVHQLRFIEAAALSEKRIDVLHLFPALLLEYQLSEVLAVGEDRFLGLYGLAFYAWFLVYGLLFGGYGRLVGGRVI
jgi:hypothetical protein